MLKKLAVMFGVVFLLVGVLGFIPALAPAGHLLGLFHINPVHNIVHLASGAVALSAGLASEQASRLYFRVFGAVYGLVAFLGLAYGNDAILGLVANNAGDVVLHGLIAVAALYLGFAMTAVPVRVRA